jgi:hypothetical protein
LLHILWLSILKYYAAKTGLKLIQQGRRENYQTVRVNTDILNLFRSLQTEIAVSGRFLPTLVSLENYVGCTEFLTTGKTTSAGGTGRTGRTGRIYRGYSGTER